MQKAKRVISMALVILMLFSTLAWIITMLVSAADAPKAPDVIVSYSLDKVYRSIEHKADGGTSGNVYFIKGNTAKNDYSISSGRVADFTMTVVDKTVSGTQQAMLDQSAAMEAASSSAVLSVDTGSYRTTSKTVGSTTYSTEYAIKSVAPVQDATNTAVYYLAYEISIKGLAYGGSGTTLGFSLDVNATGVSYAGIVSTTITQSKEYVAPPPSSGKDDEDDEDKDIADARPHIIVSNYNYGGKDITAGEEFDLTITFRNTSTFLHVENIIMTITPPEGLIIKSSSNTFYIPKIEWEQSLTKTIKVQAAPKAEPNSHAIDIAFTFDYISEGVRKPDNKDAEKIAIPITQVDRFTVDPLELPMQIYVGEEYGLTANYINKGRSQIYNVSAEITGNIKTPGQRQNLGNVESGKTGSADFYVQSEEPGTITGEVIITYEDVNTVIKTVTLPYTIEVKAMEDMGGGMGDIGTMEPMPMPQEGQSKLWIYIIIGAGVVIAGIVGVVVYKKKKAAKKALLEDDDEDI